LLIPAAVRYKMWVYGRSIAETAGSNLAKNMDVRLLFVVCVVQVEASAKSWSLVEKSPTNGCVCVCDLDT